MNGILVSVLVGAAALYALYRRGWIRGWTPGQIGTAAAHALAELPAMLEPERVQVIEVRREAARPRPDRFGETPTSETDGGRRDES